MPPIRELSGNATWVNRWEVPSQSNPDSAYVVGQKEDGTWGCACPAWTRHTPRKDCKHIRLIKNSEPIDYAKTSAKAAAEFVRFAGQVDTAEPVFLLQTKRRIFLVDK